MAPPTRKRPAAKPAAPPTRKYKGGAQKARERKEREAQARLDEAHRREIAGEEPPPHIAAAKNLGPPPEDAVARIAWANKAAGIVLHDVMTDPVLPSEKRWKIALEAVRSLGMTSSKAVNEERLERLEAKIYGKGPDASDGLEDLEPSS